MTTMSDILIVGAGHAGAQAAIALRAQGFAGTITLAGDEPEPPYERPPLSKEYLAGDKPFDRMLIRPAAFWAERGIMLDPGRRIVAVDPAAQTAHAADGHAYRYGELVWATGGAPRRLACTGHDLAGVHAIRTRADVDLLRAELPAVTRAVVIGGGYVGLEAAAVLAAAGKTVIVLEAQDRVLARVAGEALSRFYEGEHRARGVDVRTGVTVGCVEGVAGRACGVRLTDGGVLPAELVIVGIGIEPAVAPLKEAGAAGTSGVTVDQACRTSLPHLFAIGDCAAQANPFAGGETVRIESVQNAHDQAATVARVLTGQAPPAPAVPWFWSNQYDLRLQTVGLSAGHDAVVVRGDVAARSFSLVYLRGGRVVALDCVNATRDYAQGRALVTAQAPAEPRLLADPAVPLKTLLPAQAG